MSERPTIRRIGVDDYEAVTDLLILLGRPAPSPEARDAALAVYARHLADPGTEGLLALRDGRPIGFLSLAIRERLNWTAPEAWIPDLVVVEDEHGSGAAVALFRRALEVAKDRGCHRLVLESGYARQRAHRFYAREGMDDFGKFFVIPVR